MGLKDIKESIQKKWRTVKHNKGSILFYSGLSLLVGTTGYFIFTSKKPTKQKIIGVAAAVVGTAGTVIGHRSAVKTAVTTGAALAATMLTNTDKKTKDSEFYEVLTFDKSSRLFVNNIEEDKRMLCSKLGLFDTIVEWEKQPCITLYEMYRELGLLRACRWEKVVLTKSVLVKEYNLVFDEDNQKHQVICKCEFLRPTMEDVEEGVRIKQN